VDATHIDPDQVAGPLHESVARDPGSLEFLHERPP
jgi:hypothetical protein